MEIEPLLKRIEQLAPRFGRASGDLLALVARGRSGDYKGVIQNCRLVLEVLLRAMITTELRQTPGKAMLDELISRFRQQANAGVVPTNVLAHMGTVQAWGNLGSHDHAGSLSDEGVRVGPEEVVTSLNSMVAILGWYAGKMPGTLAPGEQPAKPPAAPPRPKAVRAVGAVGLVLACLGAGTLLLRDPLPAPSPRLALDAFYAAAQEPLPPLPCRASESAGSLAEAAAHLSDATPVATQAAEGRLALELLARTADDGSAERAYLQGRAQLQAGLSADRALAKAAGCQGFAAAHNLAGKAALQAKQIEVADGHFEEAIASHPEFAKPRYNRALIRLSQQKVTEAIELLLGVVAQDPSFAEGHFLLGAGYETTGRLAEAKRSFCRAMELGYRLANERCQR